MITIASLEQNGYRYHENAFKRSSNLTPAQDPYKGLYQKCLQDTQGKKYFINFHCWDFANSFAGSQNLGREISFQAEVQFTIPNGDNINIDYLSAGQRNLPEIEAWFEKVWHLMGAQYYEKSEVA